MTNVASANPRASVAPAATTDSPAGHGHRRLLTMAVLGISELMATLDNSIVNIALPSAQHDLAFGTALRSWVITAYALAFGSLLLLGGRLTDLVGRRRAFLVGLVGFAGASALGGAAPNFEVLILARVLQGGAAALLAPAALALLTTIFAEGRDRAVAFGVFASLAVSGFATGMVLGGALTEWLGWRWCLYVNVLFAAVAFAGGVTVLPKVDSGKRPRLDLVGTVVIAAGLFCTVFGFANAEDHDWSSATVWAFLTGGLFLLVAFGIVERRVAAPLLPMRVVLDRCRGGAFVAAFTMIIGMFAIVLFLSYVLQQRLGFTPFTAGLAFLPMIACNMVSANAVGAKLLPLVGPAPLIAAGLAAGAGALFWLSFLNAHSSYAASILGPLMLMGLGMGMAVATAFNISTVGVDPQDVGVASAVMNAVHELGGAVGAALLSSVAGAVTAAAGMASPAAAAIHGYAVAFGVASVILLSGAVLCGLLIPKRPVTASGH